MDAEEKRLEELTTQLEKLQAIGEKYRQLKQEFEEKQHIYNIVQQKMSQSAYGQMQEKIKQLQTQIEEDESNLVVIKQKEEKASEDRQRVNTKYKKK